MTQLETEGVITLYHLDTTMLGGQFFYFTSATDFDTPIYRGGQEYSPIPMEATGFEMTAKGAIPQPTVKISNLFGAGNLLLDTYKGLLGAKLTRLKTLRRFLDDGATPDPQATIHWELFVVAQKTEHNALSITFRLASPMDQQGTQLPRRQILRDICSHTYRKFSHTTGDWDYSWTSCPYSGPMMFTVNDVQTNTPWEDQCSRTMNGCLLRFGRFVALPARFFPGVGRVR